MVSSFYSSNEAKERKYVKENRIRELNQEAQQDIVDAQIDAELGLESKATKMSALSKRITDKLVGTKPEVLKGDALLVRAINNGQLSDLFEKIKLLKDSALTKTQQSIRDNLSVQRNKDIINSLIQEAVPNGVDAIKYAVINALGGDGNEESVLELITKADKLNLKDFSKILTSQEKREQKLMSDEDTLSRLTTLNANQDYALREKFDNILDGVASQAKTIADKRLWKQMKAAIEKQSMADAYKEWVDNATKSAFSDKLKKNLKAIVWNQKLKQSKERGMMGQEDVNVGRPIPKSRSNSNTTTEQGSLAGEKIDMRSENKGAPPKPAKEKYKEIKEITAKPVSRRSRYEKKRLAYLRTDKNKEMMERELMGYEDKR
jgi:hypothetical protein